MAALRQPLNELLEEEKEAYQEALSKCSSDSQGDDDIQLNMRIRLVDGDTILADTDQEGSFLATCKRFEDYVIERFG